MTAKPRTLATIAVLWATVFWELGFPQPSYGQNVAYPTRQVSFATVGRSDYPSINADGTLITFRSSSPIGSNTDGNYEIYLFDRSTGVVSQLTDSEECENGFPQISADGTRIVFDSDCDLIRPSCEYLCANGSPCVPGPTCPGFPPQLCLLRCPGGSSCSAGCPGTNADLSAEIFSVDTASSAISQLTDSPCDHYEPVINADGTRVAFRLDCGFGFSLVLEDLTEGTEQGLVSALGCDLLYLSIDAAGTRIAFSSSCDLTGSNSDASPEIFLFDTSTGVTTQLSDYGSCCSCVSYLPRISADGTRIGFSSRCNLTGGNADGGLEAFLHDTLAGTTAQLTDSTGCNNALIRADGSRLLFGSNCDPTGANADGNYEFFVLDGVEVRQLTNSADCNFSVSSLPSANGVFLAFGSDCDPTGDNPDGTKEIFLLDTTLEVRQITHASGCESYASSFDAAGTRAAFVSDCNPTGENGDGSLELFLVDLTSGSSVFDQLTSSTGCSVGGPASDGNASRVAYSSNCNYGQNGDGNEEIFIADVSSGISTQVTQSESCSNRSSSISAAGDGVAYTSDCYVPFSNEDENRELFLASTPRDGGITNMQITQSTSCSNGFAELAGAGTHVLLQSTCDYNLLNPGGNFHAFLWDLESDSAVQISSDFGSCSVGTPHVSGDANRAALYSMCSLGDNPDGNWEIFSWDASAGLQQVSSTTGCSNVSPTVSSNGTTSFFRSTCDTTGFNPDGNLELFFVDYPTSLPGDGMGASVPDPRMAQAITTSGSCYNGDSGAAGSLNSNGRRAIFPSECDITGENPDGSTELFLARHILPGEANVVRGNVQYYTGGRPVPHVTLKLGDTPLDTSVTYTDGNFQLTELAGGDRTLVAEKSGDFNNAISSLDASRILQHVVGLTTLGPFQQLACDVTGNGTLSSLDAARVLQLRVGLLSRLPVAEDCGSDWGFVPIPAPIANQSVIDFAPAIPCQAGGIDYTPLEGTAADQDFLALLFGDCTGNWAPAEAGTASVVRNDTSSSRVYLGPPERVRRRRVRVPIRVASQQPYQSLELQLRLDPSQGRVRRVRKTTASRRAILQSHVDETGRVTIALASPSPLESSNDDVLWVEIDSSRNRTLDLPRLRWSTVDDRPARIENGGPEKGAAPIPHPPRKMEEGR